MGQGTSKTRKEILSFREIDASHLEEFLSKMHSFEDNFFGTTEEVLHYYCKPDIKFYEVVDGINFGTVGSMCVVSSGSSTHVGAITMDPSYIDAGAIFPLDYQMMFNERNGVNLPFVNATYPSKMRFSDINTGRVCWGINEFTVHSDDIVEEPIDLLDDFEIERLKETGIEEILGFERELFMRQLPGRRDYIETCLRRSDMAYVVRNKLTEEIESFGMISKPENGKMLLGPVYGNDFEPSGIVVDALLNYAKTSISNIDITAYCPENSRGHAILSNHSKIERTSKRWLRRSLCENYQIKESKIIALGSLVFDVC